MNDDYEQEEIQFEHLIQGLISNGYGYNDDFMTTDSVLGLRNNIQNLSTSGKMKSAGLGSQKDYHKNKLIRGDKIKWIETTSDDQYEVLFLKKIKHFINYLNRTCYTSINTFESHYADYEQNSFYKRHLDQFKNNKGRKYSLIFYLNADWQEEDGGLLSLYPKDGEQKDIAPIGGRMVFFKSDEMEHEVYPSFTRNRISIAGWLKG